MDMLSRMTLAFLQKKHFLGADKQSSRILLADRCSLCTAAKQLCIASCISACSLLHQLPCPVFFHRFFQDLSGGRISIR